METTQERNQQGELVTTKVVTKHIVPDTAAQIFWLKNRAADKWRDKPIEDSNEEDKSISVTLSIEDLSGGGNA